MFNWKEMNAFSLMDLLELANNSWSKLRKLTAARKTPPVTDEKSASTAPPPANVSETKKSKADEAEFGRLLATLKALDPASHKQIVHLMAAMATISEYFVDDFRVFILNVPNRMDEIKKAMKGPSQGKGGTPATKESTWVRDFTFTQRDARVQMLQYIASGRKAIRGNDAVKNALVIRWLTVETNFVKTISPEEARWNVVKKWVGENAPNLRIAAAIAVIGNERTSAIIAGVKVQNLGAGEQAEIERQLLAEMRSCNTAKRRALNLPDPQPHGAIKPPGKILSLWHIIPASIILTMVLIIAIK
jgi:hypothetical protein